MLDLDENFVYRRISITSRPSGGFIYVLHIPDTNYVEFGLGWESKNRLQRKHVATDNIHQLSVHEVATKIQREGINLKLGSLAQILTGDPDAQEYFLAPKEPDVEDEDSGKNSDDIISFSTFPGHHDSGGLAKAVREVHDDAWGNPLAWEPQIVSLGDGRVVWVMYDDDSGKIRLGIGMIDAANEPVLGDNSYILPKDFIAEFVSRIWTGKVIFFFSVPPRWPFEFDRAVDNPTNLRQIAATILKLADEVWPGEIDAPDDEYDLS